MALSITLTKQTEDEPLTVKRLITLLNTSHDDTPIMLKIGDVYHHVSEVRQVTDLAVSRSVLKVLVPVDNPVITG